MSELFYIGMPVVRTDGRSLGVRSRDYQIFSQWVDYHIFFAIGLRPRAVLRDDLARSVIMPDG